MKKIAIIIILALVTLNLSSEQMSLSEAQIVAQNWYSYITDIDNPIISKNDILTENDISTAFIFNFSDGGFVLTSATNDVIPILGYNDEGEIGYNNGPEFEWLIDGYNEQIYDVIDSGIIVQENRDLWLDLSNNNMPSDEISIILEMPRTWHQGSPYNDFVPAIDGTRCVAGCGPVAMGQIINYHKYIADYEFDNEIVPSNYTTFTDESIEIDEQALIYDFPDFEELDVYMDEIRSVFDSNQNLTTDEHLAALSFASGISQKAMYGVDQTGVWSTQLEGYKKCFGYYAERQCKSSYTYQLWCQLLENELLSDRPIHYRGSGSGVHAFVIHGCNIVSCDPEYFFLINWGWSENNHGGFYALQSLTPGNHNFTESQRAIINIKPAALTITGQAIDGNSYADIIFEVDVSCENLTTNQIVTGNFYPFQGVYTIQFDEMPEINTIFRIDYESSRYEDTDQYFQVVDNSNYMLVPDIELFWVEKPIYNDWNWESFPVLDRDNNETIAAVPVLETISNFGEITHIEVRNEGYEGYGNLEYNPPDWTNPNYQLQSSRCYKIKVLPDIQNVGTPRTIPREGTLLQANTSISLFAGEDNWIGYWVKDNQDTDDAFGDHFDKVVSIKAEDWAYIWDTPRSEPRPSSTIRPLYYEKGYVIRVNEDIPNFQWNISNETPSESNKQEPEYFVYNELPDYEVIDIMEIPDNTIEIGVFQDEVCVGAIVVDEPAEQVLVYTDDTVRGSGDISFQLINNQRNIEQISDYEVLNPNTGLYINGNLYAGRIDFAQVKIPNDGNQNNTPELHILKADNYPNPFNPSGAGRSPTTIIEFSLPNDSKVQLSVYNLKGQKVRTLLKSDMLYGTHTAIWNGKDTNDKSVASGVYFFKLKTDKKELVKKMLLLK